MLWLISDRPNRENCKRAVLLFYILDNCVGLHIMLDIDQRLGDTFLNLSPLINTLVLTNIVLLLLAE